MKTLRPLILLVLGTAFILPLVAGCGSSSADEAPTNTPAPASDKTTAKGSTPPLKASTD